MEQNASKGTRQGARCVLTPEARARIRDLRQEARLSKQELATAAGVTYKTICNMEHQTSRRSRFNELTVEWVAKALGKTAGELLGRAQGPEFKGGKKGARSSGAVRLTDKELLAFYANAQPLSARVREREYRVPVELVIEPRAASLDEERVQFDVVDEQFAPPERIEPYTTPMKEEIFEEAQRNHLLFDGKVVSLRGLQRTEDGWHGRLLRGSYFDALSTNFRGLDRKPEGETATLRERLSGRTRALEPLEISALVNHLGVVCLIESCDGKLVAQERSSRVANRGNTLSASVTGALDWKDVKPWAGGQITLAELARAGALREVENELGIEAGKCRFLGLVREFERGGKPELYLFARSELSFASIKAALQTKAPERYETTGLVALPLCTEELEGGGEAEREAFEKRIEAALERARQKGNLTLAVGLILLAQVAFTPRS